MLLNLLIAIGSLIAAVAFVVVVLVLWVHND
jgi:hypothetical protein